MLTLAAGLTMAACSGGSSSSGSTSTTQATLNANQWASQVCGKITTWMNELQTSSSHAVSGLNGTDLQAIKTQFVNFLAGAAASTSTMISGVQEAGVPGVQHGQAISQGLVSGLQGIQTAFVQAQNQALALPTDNPTGLSNGAQALINSLQGAGNQIKTSLNSLDRRYSSPELDAALKNQAACQPLNK